MRPRLLFLLLSLLLVTKTLGNGVAIVDASTPKYLTLLSSDIYVNVNNQVSQVITTQVFKNELGDSANIKYAFPLPSDASATELSWYVNGKWEKANISAEPQDTTLPGGTPNQVHYTTAEYLGESPLFFTVKQGIAADSTITIKLKYVQLLKYEFGTVNFMYPSDYRLIQPTPINGQYFEFNLISGRTIENIELKDNNLATIENTGNQAKVIYDVFDIPAELDIELEYSLSKEELGLFGFSTMLPDSIVFDNENGSGYFTFIAEPNPEDNTEIIDKVFTLIIDRSGSMGGTKIEQARDAASFIVNNLNPEDKFNIVDFESGVNSFRYNHVLNTLDNRNAALNYISNIYSGGGTNISGALSKAISQYSNTGGETANIIIFFTDGQASSGITDTDGILRHVQDEIDNYGVEVTIFSFGIGNGANKQLLTLLASQNKGIAQFLENNQLEESITEFYLKIQSPVLLDTEISFSNSSVTEIYPNPLPSLYQGQQMIVSGRYNSPGSTEITLSGSAFGKEVEYKYDLSLSDTTVTANQFLTKIWAKQKIENLMVKYYALDYNSAKADSLHEVILTLSIAYGIITDFTSFTDESDLTDVEESEISESEEIKKDFQLLGNYPNPFNPSTKIKFSVGKDYKDIATVKIYNAIGQLVKTLIVNINGKGIYEITWNGDSDSGNLMPSGMYIYTIDFGNALLSGKMTLIK